MRRYQSRWTRFSQPDPSDGSYDVSDPQSFNRYSYVKNDPVNLVDPSGLDDVVRVYTWAPKWGPFDASTGGFSGIMRHYTENEPFFTAPFWRNGERRSTAEPKNVSSQDYVKDSQRCANLVECLNKAEDDYRRRSKELEKQYEEGLKPTREELKQAVVKLGILLNLRAF